MILLLKYHINISKNLSHKAVNNMWKKFEK